MALQDEFEQARMVEPARILRMPPVDQIGQRLDLPAIGQPDGAESLVIDLVELLALGQVGMGRLHLGGGHAEGDAVAGAAMVKAEHEARRLDRATMPHRIDAERPMGTAQQGRDALDMRETRPPHQRAIAEDPEVPAGDLRSD